MDEFINKRLNKLSELDRQLDVIGEKIRIERFHLYKNERKAATGKRTVRSMTAPASSNLPLSDLVNLLTLALKEFDVLSSESHNSRQLIAKELEIKNLQHLIKVHSNKINKED